MPQLTIIIISHNTKNILRACVESIYSTISKTSFELIVVDNASSDGSAEMVKTIFPRAIVISNALNVGFSKASNQAIKISTGEYVMLLNSDTLLVAGAIDTLVDFMDSQHDAAAVGPKILNIDGSLQSKGFYFPSVSWAFITLLRVNKILTEQKKRKIFHRFCWSEDDTKSVDWVSGCCLVVSKEAIKKIGMLSEDFFMYSEEVEWCYRAKKNGFKVWYLPITQIYHLNEASPFVNRGKVFNKSRIIFYKKTIGLYNAAVISLLALISLWITYLRISISARNKHEKSECLRNIRSEVTLLKLILTSMGNRKHFSIERYR